MPRFRLTLEYHGGPFAGWQRQKNGRSVQEALEEALGAIEPARPTVQGAGRTDAGVHAQGQVAHVDLVRDWQAQALQAAVNGQLRAEPVTVLRAEPVAAGFHARFDAIERVYLYRILNRMAPPALLRGLVWHCPHPLDVAVMQDAARRLPGTHDFTTFRAARCQADSPVKTLDALEVAQAGDEIRIRAVARSFLHRQVRSMVGALERVGARRLTADALQAALEARDRAACPAVAPAAGLCLERVRYPEPVCTVCTAPEGTVEDARDPVAQPDRATAS